MEYTIDESTKISSINDMELLQERYRPVTMNDIIITDKLRDTINKWIETKTIPNFLLYSEMGGLGKDSIISILSNELQDSHTFVTINGGIYRNVSDIKEQVLARVKFASGIERLVIYLSEVGEMNKAGLDSLKGLIEENTHVTFIMSTNTLKNISQPLQSRFEMYDIGNVSKDEKKGLIIAFIKRLKGILTLEGIEHDNDTLKRYALFHKTAFRDAVKNISKYTVGGKLIFDDSSDTNVEINEYLGYIMNNDVKNIVSQSKMIDCYSFVAYLNVNRHIINIKDMPTVIIALNELQKEITMSVPFLDISLIAFSMEIIGTKFRLNTNK